MKTDKNKIKKKSSLRKNLNNNLNTPQLIVLGFLFLIFVGSLVLMLPICSASGEWTPYIDALFTATTSVCVTGLTVVSTANHWNMFGQSIILILVQLGGLGVVATVIFVFVLTRKKIDLRNRIVIQEAYGIDNLKYVVDIIVRIVRDTFIVEGVGFLCLLPVLVSKFGPKGIWHSFFLSISAFCNAGMDTMGDSSLAEFTGNYWINGVIMVIIILSGLGFVVWMESLALLREKKKKKWSRRTAWAKLSVHTKIVLVSTAALLLFGMVTVFIFEYNNPETLGPLSLPQKLTAAMFQSVTTRTAGFYTVPQAGLTDSSSLISMLLMFIGGSPSGTAGGVKTVTVAMLTISVMSTIKGESEMKAFNRQIPRDNVRKGLAIIILSMVIWFVMTTILCAVESADFSTVCYETMSAIGTVGLSKDFTGTLHMSGKIVIIIMMYLGRIGPVTLATALLDKGNPDDLIHYPEEHILIG